jgi:hypothetical protein
LNPVLIRHESIDETSSFDFFLDTAILWPKIQKKKGHVIRKRDPVGCVYARRRRTFAGPDPRKKIIGGDLQDQSGFERTIYHRLQVILYSRSFLS